MDNDYVLGLEAQGYLTFLDQEAETPVDSIVTAPLSQAITLSSDTVTLPANEAKARRRAGQHSVSDARQKMRQRASRHKK